MFKLSEDFYYRKRLLERNEVPTQTMMIKKMHAPLAQVYFKSMAPKYKVLAGFEPPMKGGGSDWYQPPKDLLEGRAVLKPVKHEHIKKLGYHGIDCLCEKIVTAHRKTINDELHRVLSDSESNWMNIIEVSRRQEYEDASKQQARLNTEKIKQAYAEFSVMYVTSITKIETVLFDAAVKQVQRVREGAYQKMKERFHILLKEQSTKLYDKYENKLANEKAKLKAQFIDNIEKCRTDMGNKFHDIKVEKHMAIEKLRHFVECQNLACQIYVALKERDECQKEMDLSEHKHVKKMKLLTDDIIMKDFEIRLEMEKEQKRQEFIKLWQKKICHVVKKFQMFVQYCLQTLPQHAEFFINMEKLMMLQLNEASENPSAESIFEPEIKFDTPIPKPHPFYLFCDKGVKLEVDQNLCPKHCTSSATQMPVVVVNKRFIYAACDNFEQYTDKLRQFNCGQRGNDVDFEDDQDYTINIPVKYTLSQQLLELKLESSIMQVLQQELPNIREVPIECCVCKIPYCFCSPDKSDTMDTDKKESPSTSKRIPSGNKITERRAELEHEREPKWESYLEYVLPKKCTCAKIAKSHLKEYMPPYMRNMSKYVAPPLLNYKPCSVNTLKNLVDKAKGKRPRALKPLIEEPKTQDMETQYEDLEFDKICTCFSDEEITKLFEALIKGPKIFTETAEKKCEVVGSTFSATYLTKTASSFAAERAYSLRNLLDNEPQLEELFKKEFCQDE